MPATDETPTQPDQRLQGLTAASAAELLKRYGPNEVRESRESPWLTFARHFWAPVPWMLEAAIILTIALGRQADAVIIFFLLVFNAVVSYFQENRAGNALALLRKRLAVNSRVLRDGRWQLVPARELVPGDVVHVRVGDIVPADLQLLQGNLMLDQSALTGESVAVEAGAGTMAYAAAIVRRGAIRRGIPEPGPRRSRARRAGWGRGCQSGSTGD